MKADSYNSWNSRGLKVHTSRKIRHEHLQALSNVFHIVHCAAWLENRCEQAVIVGHRTCTTLAHSLMPQQSSKSRK
jgi:hypothetical protein